jgi:rhodanese-related sulfurtransferase
VKRLFLFLTLFSLILASVVPVLAQDVPEETVAEYLAAVPQGFGGISVNDVALQLVEDPPFLLDVRQPNEYDEGFVPGAISIPLREVAANLDKLPADLNAPIVVYCKSGHRGAIGMTVLQMLGYTNVRNMSGGIMGWTAAGNEVIMEPVEAVSGEVPPIDANLVAAVDNYLMNVLPDGWGLVSVDNLALELLESPPFLLDVREVAEWETVGYIEDAVNVPVREVGFNLDQLPDKDTPIVVYCASGHRGAIAMTALQVLGYDVRNLAGGISGWIGADYDVVGGVEAAAPAEGMVLDAATLAPVVYSEVVDVAQKPGFGTITNDGLREVMGEVFLLDVREDDERAEGHIEGAVHVPLREIAANLQLLPTDLNTPMVVYCAIGHRGAMAQFSLELLGYTDVMNLRGGMRGWDGDVVMDEVEPVENEPAAVDPDVLATVDNYLSGLEGFGSISVGDFDTLMLEAETAPFIIDVREANEYAAGFITGAVNMPMRSFDEVVDTLPATDVPVIIYGSSGPRGATVMTALQMLGYNARNLAGGSAGYVNAGFELVTE